MTSKNDITGDNIKTKGTYSQQGRDNWDTIFGKNKKESKEPVEDTTTQNGKSPGK